MKRIVPIINIDNISTIDPIKNIMRTIVIGMDKKKIKIEN